jgi:2-polyprenyl-6-methoxyphenol hydroxylase-like FAD-dependent oxidoreductase
MAAANPLRSRYDVVIAGARCAGAATALLLARRGLRVLVVDRGQYGTDTLSTLALMRGGVALLHAWGFVGALEAEGTPVVRSTSFHYEERELRIAIKARDGVPGLFAPRRYLLDRLLVDAARAAGAEVVYGRRVADLVRNADGRVAAVSVEDGNGELVRIAADVVVGADGLRSTVARLAGAEPRRSGRHASATVYGYFSGLENDGFHWHFSPGASAGRIPTNAGLTLVFAATSAERFRRELSRDVPAGFARVLAECSPALAASVAAVPGVGGLHGFAGHVGVMRRPWGPGFALVGDAGYFKDPITAHGITDALRDALLAAEAIAEGTDQALARYEQVRDELSLGLFEVTDRIASFEWSLSALEQLHLTLADEMKREVAALAERRAASVLSSRLSA